MAVITDDTGQSAPTIPFGHGGARPGSGPKPGAPGPGRKRVGGAAGDDAYLRYSLARAKHEEAKAALATLAVQREKAEYQERIGRLVEAERARDAFSDVVKHFARILDTLPDLLERDVGLRPRQVEAVRRLGDDLRRKAADYLEGLRGGG